MSFAFRCAAAATLIGASTAAIFAWRLRQQAKKKRLSIFDWNILLPMFADPAEYEHIGADLNLLHKEKRLLLVIQRILDSDADVITLQEVQEDQYEVIRMELAHKYEALGPTYHILPYWIEEYLAKDAEPMQHGQATFLRKGMFKLLREKTIQTTHDGSRFQLAALQTTEWFARNFILVNLHLESGNEEVKQARRQNQIIMIREELRTMSQEIVKSGESEPCVILVGDFNTFGDRLGMTEVRNQGFVDVAEMLCNERPTFIALDDETIEIALDHVALLKSDVELGRISARKLLVPDLASPDYNAANHKQTILDALYGRLKRRGLSLKEALNDTETFDIITHIPPSREDFKEHQALKALRVGSDHLPMYAEIELA